MIEIKGTPDGIEAKIEADTRELATFMSTLVKEVIADIGVKDKMIAIYLSAVIHKAAVDGLEDAADKLLKSEGGLPS